MGVSGKYRAMIGWSTSETGLYIFDLIPMLRFICTISSLKIKLLNLTELLVQGYLNVTRNSPRMCRPERHVESFSRERDSWFNPSFNNSQSIHPKNYIEHHENHS